MEKVQWYPPLSWLFIPEGELVKWLEVYKTQNQGNSRLCAKSRALTNLVNVIYGMNIVNFMVWICNLSKSIIVCVL